MRAEIVREVALRNALAASRERAAQLDGRRVGNVGFSRFRLPQRAFALGFAATLVLGTGAAVAAAPPGSPFYNARITIESALLPTQIDARFASHEQHLAERLVEVETAASRGDTVALEAALDAYRTEMDAAVADIGEDADRLTKLDRVLSKHTVVLEALAGRLPEQAAIEHAIDVSHKASDKLKDRAAHPGGGRPSEPPGKNGASQPGQ